jgi:hypothetical protein
MAHQFREGILPMRRIKKKHLKAAVDQQLYNSIKFLQGNYMHATRHKFR